MDALCIRPGDVCGLNAGRIQRGKGVEDQLSNSSADEDDGEPSPPAVVRRKVSFADAFGLNLVSVKEFDNVESANAAAAVPSDMEEAVSTKDVHMCRLFTVPTSNEELEEKVQERMLELESIELLPKTTTLRGIVRVLNLCYNKAVYVRMTLDRWRSHFDLLAEYVPGSSDRKTDRFTFQYTLVPPFDKDGTRLEFCLRYETSAGTFWANNNKMNYALLCYQKVKDNNGPQTQEESSKSKKSCLKTNRRESEEEPIKEAPNTDTNATGSKGTVKAAGSKQSHRELSSNVEENNQTVDGKSRQRIARWTHAPEQRVQRRQRVRQGCSRDVPRHQKGCNSSSFLHESNRAQHGSGAQVLTYNRTPLTALDRAADERWAGGAKVTLSKSHGESGANETSAATNPRETFVNRTEESHVFDVWQVFINGSDCEASADVPESKWLPTATPASSSNNEDPLVSRQVHVGQDTPDLEAASSNACHPPPPPPPDTAETSAANVALNGDDREAPAYVRSPRGDNASRTRDAPQRSETNSARGAARGFSLAGAEPVSKGSADSPSECGEREIWEREGAGITGGTRGADSVTSSGESQTTDMTAMPESPNARAVDTISRGAGPRRGLSGGADGKVTAAAYNTADDTLAFKETMRQGTADGERFVFSAHGRGAGEGLTTKCAGNKVSKKEEIVRPREREKCQVSRGGFSPEYDSLERCEQNETDASSLDGLRSVGNSQDYLPNLCKGFNLESQEVQFKNGHKAESDAKCEITPAFNMDEWPHKNSDSQKALARHNENTAILPEINISQTKPQPRGEKLNDKDEIQEVNATRIETDVTGDRVFQTEKDCCEIMQERQKPREEIPPSTVTKEEPFSTAERTLGTEMIYQSDTSQSLADPKVEEISWSHSRGVHEDDVGSRMSSEEVVLKETATSVTLRPETLERMEEDIIQGDKDERARIGKLKIEAKKWVWAGKAETPGGESGNAAAKLKEQELSAEVESSPRVEYQKISEQTKKPISGDGVGKPERAEKREMLPEGSGHEPDATLRQEAFDCRRVRQTSTTQADGGRRTRDGRRERPLSAPDERCGETLPADCAEGQALDQRDEEIHFESAHARNGLNHTSDTQSRPPSLGSTRGSAGGRGSIETKHRSVTRAAPDDSEVKSGDGCNETLEIDFSKRELKLVPTWQNMLHILFHVTRLLVCVLLVAGFFLIFFFYDFKTFFVLYSFSMCCWIYKWRSFQLFQKDEGDEIETMAFTSQVETG